MNILNIISNLGRGGAESTLLKILLNDQSNKHIVISLKKDGELAEIIKNNNIQLYELNFKFFNIFIYYKIGKIILKNRPDIIQTWMYHADLIGGLAARLAGCRKVIWGIRTTNIFPGKGVSRNTKWILKLCAILSNFIPHTILCVANRSKAVHAEKGYTSSKMTVVSNGFEVKTYKLDLDIRHRIRQSLNVSSDTLIIGSIGRFNEYKDHRSFVLPILN